MSRRRSAALPHPAATRALADAHAGGPIDETQVVLDLWHTGPRTEGTVVRVGELAARFGARLAVTGVASLRDATLADCENFVWAPTRRSRPPSMHTVHLRRTALRAVYRTLRELDPTITDPSYPLDLPGKPDPRTRALTDLEVTLVRTAALSRTRRPMRAAAAVALAEATATTGELHQIRWDHLDLDTGTVRLAGADPIQPRTGQLTTWGVGVLLHLAPADSGLVVERHGASSDAHVAQASMSNLLARLLDEAGVHDPTVKPSSIRLWGATQTLHRCGLEAAAIALGLDSLDRTADTLGYRWQVK